MIRERRNRLATTFQPARPRPTNFQCAERKPSPPRSGMISWRHSTPGHGPPKAPRGAQGQQDDSPEPGWLKHQAALPCQPTKQACCRHVTSCASSAALASLCDPRQHRCALDATRGNRFTNTSQQARPRNTSHRAEANWRPDRQGRLEPTLPVARLTKYPISDRPNAAKSVAAQETRRARFDLAGLRHASAKALDPP